MITAFLSYAKVDGTAQAQRLFRDLTTAGREPWLDSQGIGAGEKWNQSLREAIRSAEAFILLVTPGSMKSVEVGREIDEALRLRKHIVSVMVPETGDAQLPQKLSEYQAVDFREDDRNAFARLTHSLDALWGKVDTEFITLMALEILPPEITKFVEKLQNTAKLGAKLGSPPEIYSAFVDLVRKIAARKRAGTAIAASIDAVLASQFPEPGWEWSSVLAANRSFMSKLLIAWREELPETLAGTPIPVVLVVMTKQQAQELASGAAFAGSSSDLARVFADLQASVLNRVEFQNWLDRYGVRRQDFQPFGAGPTLGEVMTKELKDLPKPFAPRFLDVEQIVDPKRREELRNARRNACIVVMDIVSMCHPQLHDAYRRTLLDAYPATFIIKLKPPGLPDWKEEIVSQVRHYFDLEFFNRFTLDQDISCEEIPDQLRLARFVKNMFGKGAPGTDWVAGSRDDARSGQ